MYCSVSQCFKNFCSKCVLRSFKVVVINLSSVYSILNWFYLSLKNGISFLTQVYFFNFLQMSIFKTLFPRCTTLWSLRLKMKTLFGRCLTFSLELNVTIHNVESTFFQRCRFQRWHAQCCFNFDLTLPDVAMSYLPKNNIETILQCFLGLSWIILKINAVIPVR